MLCLAARQLYEAYHQLAKLGIWHTDHGGVAKRRMGNQDLLDFDRRNIRTAGNNQALLTADEPEIALFILSHEGASTKPAVLQRVFYQSWPSPIANGNIGLRKTSSPITPRATGT